MAPLVDSDSVSSSITNLCRALRRKGHLVEIILPKYVFKIYILRSLCIWSLKLQFCEKSVFWYLALFDSFSSSSPQIFDLLILIVGIFADTHLWTSVLWTTSKILEQICTLILVGTGIRTGFGLGNYPHNQTPYVFLIIINRCMCDILNNFLI